ncbi:putative membrane protein [Agrobacterium fabrum str. J-07]|uniref:ABC transporter permease n=2 Tax=Rhizobium/Agrobacterium group TaxID=227290 RepID=A0ABR5D1E3_9HYPH|nr:ABC transporter permease [Agrobacterium arsenijevicii]CUX58820.1 putative membrane protein [Agrobacterium fabrum str. J-07]
MTDGVVSSTGQIVGSQTSPWNLQRFQAVASSALISVPILTWLALIVVMPSLLLIGVSFLKSTGGVIRFEPSLANYLRLWNSSGFWVLLGRTLAYSFAGCLVASFIAYPLAFYVGRVITRNRALLTTLIILPLWISLLMRVFAWRVILGQSGVLNTFLVSSGILQEPSNAFLYSPLAVVMVFAYIAIPFIFISTMGAFEKIPQDLIEAAQDSGANAFFTFVTLVWPLTRRNFAIGFSLAFLVTVGDFVTPAMIGGIDGTTVGVVISTQFGFANNWPYGAAAAVVLMVSVGVLLSIVLALCPSRGVMLSVEGDNSQAQTIASNTIGRLIGALGTGMAIVYLYAPLAIIFIFSLNSSSVQVFPLQELSLQWYASLTSNESLIAAAQRSLIVAISVVCLAAALGTLFAVIIHNGRLKGARYYELAFALPVATPGVVLGIEMVLGTEIFGIPSGILRIIVGQMSFVMPVTLLMVLVRLRKIDPSLMEASLDLGANRLKSFTSVLWPLIKGTVLASAFLGLTLSADDVMVTLFLSGGAPTLPIWVFNQLRFGFTPEVNAVFSLLMFVCLVIVFLTNRQASRSRG